MSESRNPDGAHVVLYTTDKRILLYKRDLCKRDGSPLIHPGHWALFGGEIECGRDGNDPQRADSNELRDELAGYESEPDSFEPLCCIRVTRPNRHPLIHYYTAPLDRTIYQLTLREEGSGLGLFSQEEIDHIPIRPEDRLAIERFFQGPRFGYVRDSFTL